VSKLKNLITASLLMISMVSLSSCGPASQSELKNQEELTSNDINAANLVPPEGWLSYTFSSGNMVTIYDSLGHFIIKINACGVGDSGAIGLEQYNEISKLSNAAMKLPPLAEQKCFLFPYQGPYGLGSMWVVEVKLEDGTKRKIFDGTSREDMCSTIPDQDLAKNLAMALSKVMTHASTNSCRRE
jgi:hypothetical protein